MYYLFHGDDVTRLRRDALAYAEKLAEHGSVETITDEMADETVLRDALGATSLFREREVYVFDTLSRNTEAFDALKTLLRELKGSENHFVLIEGPLDAKIGKLLSTHAAASTHYPRTAERPFNIFSLTDALALRDKKSLWLLLTEALQKGKTAEEITGTLLWQLKTIRVAAQTESASEARMKPFVYDKAKRALKKFSLEELTDYAHDLVVLYHEGHTGKRDIERALERWVLGL
jgi:DNA polymerase III delta subunit